ncbi:hypothetical protein [Actinomadura sp. CNU-125]|uniref:hypothetical protein n=1 Tax=Actinomadura sp. CNU-125 TaxID=1904961 RepID=UPI0039678A70
MDQMGLSDRLHKEGAVHHGCEFRVEGESFFADYSAMYDNKPHYVFPQQEVVSDLLDGFEAAAGPPCTRRPPRKSCNGRGRPAWSARTERSCTPSLSRAPTASTAPPARPRRGSCSRNTACSTSSAG